MPYASSDSGSSRSRRARSGANPRMMPPLADGGCIDRAPHLHGTRGGRRYRAVVEAQYLVVPRQTYECDQPAARRFLIRHDVSAVAEDGRNGLPAIGDLFDMFDFDHHGFDHDEHGDHDDHGDHGDR